MTSAPSMFLYSWFCIGLIFGSLTNVMGYRIPRRESIVHPRSHCTRCHTPVKYYDLIPIFSWLLLGGRCRACRVPIPVRYPVIELASGCLFSLSFMNSVTLQAQLAWNVFWLLMIVAMVTDLTSMKIPNVITYPGALVSAGLSITCGIQHWANALAGMVICAGVLWLIHILSGGKMGLGDAKLYLSIGAMLGPAYGLLSLVTASFVATVVATILRITGVMRKTEFIPFAPYITIGVVIATFFGHGIVKWYLVTILHV